MCVREKKKKKRSAPDGVRRRQLVAGYELMIAIYSMQDRGAQLLCGACGKEIDYVSDGR